MLKLIGRLAAGLGASALVAAAGLAVTAAPASAAPGVDLGVTVKSGVVASGSAGKPFIAKVTNHGDAKAEGFEFVFDVSGLDTKKVAFQLPEGAEDCRTDVTDVICEFTSLLVANDSVEIALLITPVPGGDTGDAGSFSLTVTNDKDTNKANDTATNKVSVSPAGVDIWVWANDVSAGYDDETDEVQRIAPGGTGELEFEVFNRGSVAARGIDLTLQLPEHTSFEADLELCTTSSDRRRITCSVADFVFIAGDGFGETLPVKVAADAPQPVDLKGSIEARAHGVAEEALASNKRAATTAPAWMTTEQFDPAEVDNKDNTDDFVVFVGATTGGGGGGLPMTGPKAIAIGGVGAAVLAVGVFLFVSARRRRVILVTPAE